MNSLFVLLFRPIINALNRIENKLDSVLALQEETMTLVSIEQSTLDDIATTVSDVADDLQAILDSDTDTPPADITAITAAVEKLQAVGPKTEEVEDAPHPDQTLPEDL